jgi:hypothetical protein
MKYGNTTSFLLIYVWLFLVAILLGVVLAHRSTGANALHAWAETSAENHSQMGLCRHMCYRCTSPTCCLEWCSRGVSASPSNLGVVAWPTKAADRARPWSIHARTYAPDGRPGRSSLRPC